MAVSPTQINAFACERRGAFDYWGKEYYPDIVKEPPGESLLLGRELHGFAEDWLKLGKQPDRLTQAGEMFIYGLPYLPNPSPETKERVEGNFTVKVSGIVYSGFMDYRGPLANFGCGDQPHRGGRPIARVLIDHKSSKNPKTYGLWQPHTTPAVGRVPEKKGWLDDPQTLIYAVYDMIESGDLEAYLRWLYYKVPTIHSKTMLSVPSDFVITKSQCEQAFGERVHRPATRVERLKEDRADPNSLAPNTGQCNAFHKACPHSEVCVLSVTQRAFGGLGLVPLGKKKEAPKMEMDLLSQVKGLQASKKASPATVAVTKTADVVNPPEASKAPVAASTPKSEPTAAVVTRSAPRGDFNILAVFADRFGDALKLIAGDLRK